MSRSPRSLSRRGGRAWGDYRWLTVQLPEQPSFQLGLFTPGPPVHDAATAQTLRAMVAKGACNQQSGRPVDDKV